MWIFTPRGVISVVAQRRRDTREYPLVVRARSKDTIEWVRGEGIDAGVRLSGYSERTLPEVLVTPDRDYQYRLLMPRDVMAEMLGRWAEDLTYTNFKEVSDDGLQELYHDVWNRVAEEYDYERPVPA